MYRGRSFVESLNKYVDVYDTADEVTDDYVGEHVAVAEDSVRPDQLNYDGIATMRQASTATVAAIEAGHWTLTPDAEYYGSTLPDEPGLSFLTIPIIMALIKLLSIIAVGIICVVVLYYLTRYAKNVVEYTDPDNPGVICKYITVQIGLSSAGTLDTCGNEWVAPPQTADAGLLNNVLLVGLGLAALYVGVRYILPAFMSKQSERKTT
jgi:hypothetical protein